MMMSIASSSSMNLEPGYRFDPTDQELISHYLRNKASKGSNFRDSFVIPDCPDFFNQDPWRLWESYQRDDRDSLYFFALRKKLKESDGGNRWHRRVGSGGTWANTSWEEIQRSGGVRREFRYRNGGNSDQHHAWLMTEFELSADQDLVICMLRPSTKNSTPMVSGTSNNGVDIKKGKRKSTAASNSAPKRNPKAARKTKEAPINSEASASTCVVDVNEEREDQLPLVVYESACAVDVVNEEREDQLPLVVYESACAVDVVNEEQEDQLPLVVYEQDSIPDQGLNLKDCISFDDVDSIDLNELLKFSQGQDQLPATECYQGFFPELAVDAAPIGVDGILAGLGLENNQPNPPSSEIVMAENFNGEGVLLLCHSPNNFNGGAFFDQFENRWCDSTYSLPQPLYESNGFFNLSSNQFQDTV